MSTKSSAGLNLPLLPVKLLHIVPELAIFVVQLSAEDSKLLQSFLMATFSARKVIQNQLSTATLLVNLDCMFRQSVIADIVLRMQIPPRIIILIYGRNRTVRIQTGSLQKRSHRPPRRR